MKLLTKKNIIYFLINLFYIFTAVFHIWPCLVQFKKKKPETASLMYINCLSITQIRVADSGSYSGILLESEFHCRPFMA